MTIKDLTETMIFTNSRLYIVDEHDNVLTILDNGDDCEYSEYEVMEVFAKYSSMIARVWLEN